MIQPSGAIYWPSVFLAFNLLRKNLPSFQVFLKSLDLLYQLVVREVLREIHVPDLVVISIFHARVCPVVRYKGNQVFVPGIVDGNLMPL